ncbi:MAG: hypothetical protein KJ818_04425, partial [Candidatus Omnitrophica bacterium]|nr:hypothetical protein [Candidatus Omnitrophota bacterium]
MSWNKFKIPIRIISIIISFCLLFEQSGFAQVASTLDISSKLASLHQALTINKFRPLHLRYLDYNLATNNFKLLLDKGTPGQGQSLNNEQGQSPKLASELTSGTVPALRKHDIEQTTKTLLNYFLIGITLPDSSFWVNLRPDSPDSIIDPELARTDLGKVLLEADLELKKDTALATSPETPQGKEYWDKLYTKAEELFGSGSNITIPTLTRPWIVPSEI